MDFGKVSPAARLTTRLAIGTVFICGAMGLASCSAMKPGSSQAAAAVAANSRCADTSFPIYFKPNTADLTPPARELILQTAKDIQGCQVKDVKVVGVVAEGDAMSRDRADAVSRALAEVGFPTPAYDIITGKEAREGDPLARRAEVYVTFRR